MTSDRVRLLDSLSLGFRSRYLGYEALRAQMQAWAAAFPEVCRMHSIGVTQEGREIMLLTLGTDPDRTRPSVWIDGNMHAAEFSGSNVALAIAEDVLRLHLAGPEDDHFNLPKHVLARIREVRFFVLPRMCPDGAERVLTEGTCLRSNPRDRRPATGRPRWLSHDLDGDGLALVMRVEDEGGEYVESEGFEGLMLPRRIEDSGPFYKIYPEGTIENFDGRHVPDPHFLSDNDTDMNRNFPWSWVPEPEQPGAGSFPMSEPESRSVVDFATQHPEIFAWLNLHTFGGVFIRPMGHKADVKMDPEDLGLFRQIGQWNEMLTGYPTVSGFEEFLYESEKPLHGDLTDFGYHQRGAIAYVCELWDLFTQLGIPRKRPFVDHYSQLSHNDLVRMAEWDREHNQSRVVRPWRAFDHPQLGPVELGGIDPRVGMWNPPPDRLHELCTAQSRTFFRVASLAPEITVTGVTLKALSEDLTEVEATIENVGYLGTHILASARALPWNTGLCVDARVEGCALIDAAQAHVEIGHLGGWGRGLYGSGSLFFQRSRGNIGSRTLRWIVRGGGTLHLKVGSTRVGWITHSLSLSPP